MSYHDRCGLCNKMFRSNRSHALYQSEYLFQAIGELYELLHSRPIPTDIIICHTCRTKHEKKLSFNNHRTTTSQLRRSTESMDIDEETLLINQSTQTIDVLKQDATVQCSLMATDKISLPIFFTASSHKYCIICRSYFDGTTSIIISDTIRLAMLLEHTIYLRPGVRCCKNHINDNNLKLEDVNTIKNNYNSITSITINDVPDLVGDLSSYLKKSTANTSMGKRPSLSFDNPLNYSNDDYYILIGIHKSDFYTLCQQIEMRNTDNRSISMAVGCLLTKLRLGLSNDVLSTLFSIGDKRTIGHIVESARNALIKHFVPLHLGFQHIDRETVIKYHTRPLATQLLTNGNAAAILVLDATYLYVQKSTNNLLQRKLFSLHKNRPLIKPMMIVATNGYIVSAIGPYYADWRNNDANITNHLLRTNQEDILNWLKAGDTLVVDRGFRDVLDFVRSLGLNIYMPAFLPKSKKQYTVCHSIHRLIFKYILIEHTVFFILDYRSKQQSLHY
jgi:hypothetical protein